MSKKNVVIVGGGGAGASLSRTLSAKLDPAKHNLVLINDRAFYVLFVAALRMVVTDEGKLEETALIPYDKLFHNGNGSLKIGTVTAIEEKKGEKGGAVVLEDGERVQYDVLVLAPGSIWEGVLAIPHEKSSAVEFLKQWRQKFAAAKSVVIVGGGAVGIELAGEIKDISSDTKVTIVQGNKYLLNDTYPERFRKDVEVRMRARGVDLILDDFVDDIPAEDARSVVTRKGKTVHADLVIPTRGPRPNTAFIASSLGSSSITATGHVKVQPTLQLEGHVDIFATGDVIAWTEQKQLAKTNGHNAVVAANVLSYLAEQPVKAVYKGSPEMILVTIGKNGGAAYIGLLWGILMGNKFARMLKSKDLFVPKTRENLGLA